METLLGEGITLEGILVIRETLIEQHLETGRGEKCGISLQWGKGEADIHYQSTGAWARNYTVNVQSLKR